MKQSFITICLVLFTSFVLAQTTKEKKSKPGNTLQISKLLDTKRFDYNSYPGFYMMYGIGWESFDAENNRLLDVSKYRKIENEDKNCVYAKKQIYSDKNKKVKIAFTYADAVKLFFNEKLLYSGSNIDVQIRKIATLSDTLHIELQKGINELFLVLKGSAKNFSFVFNIDDDQIQPVKQNNSLVKEAWSTPKEGLFPESAVFNPADQLIYCSNYKNQMCKDTTTTGYISKINLRGEVLKLKWVDGLISPTGICLHNNKLYVVERSNVVEISIKEGKITNRYPFPKNRRFPNDIDVDDIGNFYITGSNPGNGMTNIYILKNGKIEPWIISEELSNLNGILYDNGYLYFGHNGKKKLQKINIATKQITTITSFGSGIIDGIKKDNKGNLLVSLWRGELYKVDKEGNITLLINSVDKFNIADIEYIKEHKLIVIPAFLEGNYRAFEYEE